MSGGGGGNTTTTTAAIDPDLKRRVLPALDIVQRQFQQETERGGAARAPQGRVRGALTQQGQFAQDVAREGLGSAVETDLRNLQGQQLAGGQGTLGSARADRARQAGLADRSLALRQADLDARRRGFEGVTATAEAERQLEQELRDAPHTAASRYFGYLGAAPQSRSTTQSGGGGK